MQLDEEELVVRFFFFFFLIRCNFNNVYTSTQSFFEFRNGQLPGYNVVTIHTPQSFNIRYLLS